jgi:sn-glycerol 3-phosphate transport system substrate-binding protein
MKKRLLSVVMATTMILGSLTGCSGTTQTSAETSETKTETATTETATPATTDSSTKDTTTSSQPATTNLEGTTISFWHSMGGVNGEAIQYLVDKFNSENTAGITVAAEYQGTYDDAINKLKSAQIGNMGADLVQIYDIGTRFMIDSGWVVPMQELIDADNYDVAQIEPNIAAYYTVDNKLYSMPFILQQNNL